MTLKIKPHAIEQDFGPFTFPGVRLPNDGLHILDTDASHHLVIKPGSDLSADRILTITTGDAARTLTLSGNPTLGDWFDQGVKQADSPTFGGLTLNGAISLDGDLDFQGAQEITTTAGALTLNPATTLEVTPNANFAAGIDVTGAITVTTTVDGVDVAGANAAEYVTISLDANIDNERVITAGAGISITDNGAGSTVVIAIDEYAIDHGGLSGLADDDHTQYILHSLADAANDFLVASGANVFVKKTLAEVSAILEADLDHGSLQGLGDDDHTIYFLADGSRQLDGDLDFTGAQAITTTAGNLTLNPAGTLEVTPNANFAAGIDVTGAITVTTTVDGVDVAGANAAEYVVISLDANIDNERVLTAGGGITITDNGAGGTVVIAANFGSIDHGGLAGLGDDDHTQYFLLAGETTDAKLYSGADLILYTDGGASKSIFLDASAQKLYWGIGSGVTESYISIDTWLRAGVGPSAGVITLTSSSFDFSSGAKGAEATKFAFSGAVFAVTGNITVTGTVDGIDIAGWIDQDVTTTATPTFAGANLNGAVTINEAGADIDLRVESLNQTKMFVVNGGNDRVEIRKDGAGSQVLLKLINDRDTSQQDGDMITVLFTGGNSVGQEVNYFTLQAYFADVTDGTEDGWLLFKGYKAGALIEYCRMASASVVFNEGGLDIDFRVESDNEEYMLFVDGSTDQVSIGATPVAGYLFTLKPKGGQFTLRAEDVNTIWHWSDGQSAIYDIGDDIGGHIYMSIKNRLSASADDGDIIADYYYNMFNSADANTTVGLHRVQIIDVTDGAEDVQYQWWYMLDGAALNMYMTVGAGGFVFNEAGVAGQDFRVESDAHSHMIHVDSTTNRIGLRMANPSQGVDIGFAQPWGMRWAGDGAHAGMIISVQNWTAASSSNYFDWRFNFFNDAPALPEYAIIRVQSTIVAAGSETARIMFQTKAGGASQQWYLGPGIWNNAATGGNKGAGTLNVSGGVYLNNSAYTNPDFVLEHWATGEIVKYKDNPGARDYRAMTLGEIEDYARENFHLPDIGKEPMDIFDRGDIALLWLERIMTYLIDHEHRLIESEQ